MQNLWDPLDFEGVNPNLTNSIFLRSVKPLRGHRGTPRDKHYPRTDRPVAVGEE